MFEKPSIVPMRKRKILTEEERNRRNAYLRKYQMEWRKTHPRVLTPEQKQRKAEYEVEYRKRNRDRLIAKNRKWLSENRDRSREWHKAYVMRQRRDVLCHYGGTPPKCACCGETEFHFLGLDHINGGGHQHRKRVGSGASFYLSIKNDGYPDVFQVLCYNCNLSKGFCGECPHMRTGGDT